MMRILITGATGNVGMEVITTLSSLNKRHVIYEGVRDVQKSEITLDQYPKIKCWEFDLDNTPNFQGYLDGMDMLFLLRSPHISNVKKHFHPLLEAAKAVGVRHIVFLSIQGVERSSILIPYTPMPKVAYENLLPIQIYEVS